MKPPFTSRYDAYLYAVSINKAESGPGGFSRWLRNRFDAFIEEFPNLYNWKAKGFTWYDKHFVVATTFGKQFDDWLADQLDMERCKV